MIRWPSLVLGLLAILPMACQKAQFAEESATTDSYDVTVGDPAAADATATIEQTTAGAATTPAAPLDTATKDDLSDEQTSSDEKNSGNSGNSHGKGATSQSSSDDDSKDCSAASGVASNRVKVSGSQKTLTLSPEDAFALKVTGNMNVVHLKLSSAQPGLQLSAICLFLAGNQSRVTMDVGIVIGKVYIKARGNKSLVEAQVNKDGEIKILQLDAKGNQPSIVMQGEGKYPAVKP